MTMEYAPDAVAVVRKLPNGGYLVTGDYGSQQWPTYAATTMLETLRYVEEQLRKFPRPDVPNETDHLTAAEWLERRTAQLRGDYEGDIVLTEKM